MLRDAALLFTLISCAACGPPEPAHQPPLALKTCSTTNAPAPATISALVERLNLLPPEGPSCLLASLPRPLDVVATTSITSAQPAMNRQSPRFFLIDREVAISFVPAGDGAHLVEFGEWVSPTRTLKGELELPRTDALALDAPFTRVRFGAPATTCGLCHREEAPHDSITGGFVSLAFRPSPKSLVPLAELRQAHDDCTREGDESERCTMFHALFDFGVVRTASFDGSVALFAE